MRKQLKALILALITFSCGALVAHGQQEVFEQPRKYLGQVVTACGWLGGTSNITDKHPVSSEAKIRGLSIRKPGPITLVKDRQEYERVCLKGTIVYIGCGKGGLICVDWAHEYGIDVQHVEWLKS